MYYNFENFPIKIDGADLIANSCEITQQNSLSPHYDTQQRYTTDFNATNNIEGRLSVNYFLTGADPIKSYLFNDTGYISGYFGGLFFKSGVISDYSLKGQPYTPVNVKADILFFEPLGGTLNTSYTPKVPPHDNNIINFSNCTITSNSTSMINLNNIQSFNLNYSSEIRPVYEVYTGLNAQDIPLSRIYRGVKQLSSEIVTDNIEGSFPITGQELGILITLRHPNLSTYSETYTVSGRMINKNITSSVGEIVQNKYNIIQQTLENKPRITGVEPYITPNASMKISGVNFDNVISLQFEDRYATTYTNTSNLITATVPVDAISGQLKINTYGGEITSPYTLSYPNITITSFTPSTGRKDNLITINGTNFYRINKVMFNESSGDFNIINSTLLYAKVPEYATHGPIKVVSDSRVKSGISSALFAPSPIVDYFTPATGITGQFITISGLNFTGSKAVYFNNIISQSITVTHNSGIRAQIPTGDVWGYIAVSGSGNITGYSTTRFWPEIVITNLHPPSNSSSYGRLTISGHNFQTGMFFRTGDGSQYLVNIGGELTGFWPHFHVGTSILSGLSGYVPAASTSGPVYIYRSDGATMFRSSGNFTKRPSAPTITKVAPNFAYSGSNYNGFIEGTNFFNLASVAFSGVDEEGANPNINTWMDAFSNHYIVDSLGYRININGYTGFTLFNNMTGNMQVIVRSTNGSGYSDTAEPFVLSR